MPAGLPVPSVADNVSRPGKEVNMSRERNGRGRSTDARPVSRRFQYSIWHHPRVFRAGDQVGWCWQCGCGSSSYAAPAPRQRSAALAAIAHVHSQPGAR
jgi:hypothetical protein